MRATSTPARQWFRLLARESETPEEPELYEPQERPLYKPGPPLAGKFDEEMLHWMDIESFEGSPFGLGYRSRLYCDANVAHQRRDMRFTQHDVVARAETLGAAVFLKLRTLDFDSRPVLPDTRKLFPKQLVNTQVGASFIFPLVPSLVNVTIGSASDRPFDSSDEVTADITWLFGEGIGGTDTFVFFVNWQNNRDFLNCWPVPGFVYRYKQGDWFTLVLGFPDNAVGWRPVESVELSASYKFPRTVYSEISYRPWKPLKVHAGFEWTTQRYYRHDRKRVPDRLWHVEKRLTLGLRWDIHKNVFFDASGGYAFDRFWFEGKTYESRDMNRINLSGGLFLGFQIGVRF